jgi:hypothetical protein
MTADDYKAFCRGQIVMVQLRNNMIMAADGGDTIEVATGPAVPEDQWAQQVAQQWAQQNDGKQPTPEVLGQLLDQNPPPEKPVMMPVVIGEMEVKGGLLLVKYDYTSYERDASGEPRARKVQIHTSIVPDDVQHVSEVFGNLLT